MLVYQVVRRAHIAHVLSYNGGKTIIHGLADHFLMPFSGRVVHTVRAHRCEIRMRVCELTNDLMRLLGVAWRPVVRHLPSFHTGLSCSVGSGRALMG